MMRYTLSDGTKESDDDFYARKLRKIKELATERTLIILDNFDVTDDKNLEDIADGKYHLLITTRCDYSRTYPATIKIEEISSIAELKKVFFANYKGDEVEENDEHIEELIETVNRHTYTIELIAQHMENSGQTTEEMLGELKKEGIMSLNESISGTQAAYENLLKMFKIFSLTDEEKKILTYLSLMPIDGVKKSDFKKWASLPSLANVNSLEERGWIVKNTGGIALNPIVRDVVRHECKPTEEGCKEFLDNFAEFIDEKKSWHFTKLQKDFYANIAISIMECFGNINKNTFDFYYNTEMLLSFAVNPVLADELACKIFNYCSNEKRDSFLTGRAAYKIGWNYSFNYHLPNAIENASEWLNKSYDILKNIALDTIEEKEILTQVTINISKNYMFLYNETMNRKYYDLAEKYAQDTVDKRLQILKPGMRLYTRVAGAYLQLVDVLSVDKKYDRALELADKSIDILVPMFGELDADSSLAFSRKAIILYGLGRYEESKQYGEKAFNGYIKAYGYGSPSTYSILVLNGDCNLALGNRAEALEAYRKAEEIAKKLFSPDAKQIAEIEAKIKSTEVLT